MTAEDVIELVVQKPERSCQIGRFAEQVDGCDVGASALVTSFEQKVLGIKVRPFKEDVAVISVD